ncbi:MAG: tetratricopeptide repeat protein, partial [Bdellovibrionales bacterium]|nr:tetratricopeptide repeat protein [Bdellovibrionales bacterium]
AIRLGEAALKLYDADVETHHLLSKAYEGAKDYRQSFQIAARAIELDRSNSKSQALYAESLAGVQGVQAAIDYIMGLINTYPTEISYRMSLARIYRKEDRFFEAIETLKGILTAEANNKEAAVLMGQMYLGLKQNREALDTFLLAVTIDPSDAYPMILIGDLYLQAGEYQNALDNFERAREMNPQYPRINYFVGRSAFFLRDYKRAIEEAKKESKVNPNLGEAYVLIGESYINLGFYDADGRSAYYTKAIESLQSALRLKIQTAEIYILLARAHRLSGNLDIASSMLNVASSKESGNPEIFKEKGAIFEKKGQANQALVSYKRYLELAPSAPDYSQIQDRIRKIGGE